MGCQARGTEGLGVPISGGGRTIYIGRPAGWPRGGRARGMGLKTPSNNESLTRRHMTRGFAPAPRGTFVSAKVPKAILPRGLRPAPGSGRVTSVLRLPLGVRRRHLPVPTTDAGLRRSAFPALACKSGACRPWQARSAGRRFTGPSPLPASPMPDSLRDPASSALALGSTVGAETF